MADKASSLRKRIPATPAEGLRRSPRRRATELKAEPPLIPPAHAPVAPTASVAAASSTRRLGDISTAGRVCLVLLGLQFAAEPYLRELSHTGGAACYDPLSGLIVTEFLKMLICTAMLAWSRRASADDGKPALRGAQSDWRAAGSMWLCTGVISAGYALQDWCVDYASRPRSGVSPLLFQLLNQSKTVWAALLLRALTGVRRSRAQWLALAILTVASAVIVCRPAHALAQRSAGGHAVLDAAAQPPALLGVALGLWATAAASFLSALNQSLSEVLLGGGNGAVQQLEPAAFSRQMAAFKIALSALARLAAPAAVGAASAGGVGGAAAPAGWLAAVAAALGGGYARFWTGWRPITFAPCALSAVGGVLVGQVVQLAGGDWKGYALVGGVVSSSLYAHVARAEAVSADTSAAALLVAVSMWLYVSCPPKR